jgi:hypothetical protein
MLDRQHGKFVVACDDCDEVMDLDTDDFTAAVQEIKDSGWTIVKGRHGWEHYCPECAK